MTSDYHLSQVLLFLRSRHIKLSSRNEWLLGCYDYYLSENHSTVNNLQALKTFVFEQWLLADLRDVGEACLPHNIEVADKVELNDSYALQVDIILNVAESFYSQLQKLQKLASENLDITDVEKQSWEPKAKRMLKLTCTDGIRHVYGMEYEPIPALREPFIPGCKILITGPVECRKGVIFLTSRNVCILGGEVDSIITENAQVNVLIRKLKEIDHDAKILDSISTIDNHANSTRLIAEPNSIPSLESRSNTQETIAFTQFQDVNMDDDDDEIFLSNQLSEVENLLSVNQQNLTNNTRVESRQMSSFSECNNRSSTSRERSSVPSSFTSSNFNLPPSAVGSVARMEEEIVPTNRPSIIDRFLHSEDLTGNTNIAASDLNLSSDTTVRGLRCLFECKALRLDTTYECKARIIKLRSKPRIKNEKWLMSVDIGDEEASMEVTFHSSFLDSLFGYTALEVLSQKDRIKFNESIKEKIDQIIKEGAAKILSLRGSFFIKYLPDNDLPTVMRVRENNI